ncbi:MAG TPA: Calx-beta domain-containing protein [Vicinamibacteria bacterium]|nr:Calx-beta domain-containing protein [Vicinamibacteria bacterium]
MRLLPFACLVLWPAAASASSLASLEVYGNLHTGGVIAIVNGDINNNATVALSVGPPTGTPDPAHPMVRLDSTRFVGSLFGLEPATMYNVRVTLSDPDGVTVPFQLAQLLTTRTAAFPEPTLATLYVAPNGNDTNPGTITLPLLTIQEAADRSQAGTLVLVQPGVYRETVSVPASGTAAQPIVFRGNAPGAILDGADAAIAAGVPWTAAGGGVHTRVTGFATGHVVTEAGRLFRYESLAALQALAAGAPGGFFFDGTTLHVKFADGSAPSAHTMNVARREDGFVIDGRSNVRVENLEIRHFGAGDFGKGVYLRYASDCAVLGSRIHEVGAAGVWVKGGTRHRIEGNDFWDTSIFGWPWDETKGSSAENNAVALTDDVGRGHVIRGNHIRGFFNGIGPCGSAPPPAGFTSEVDVYDNDFREHTDDALEPEGYCSNVRIFGNRITDVHMAFATAPAAPGPLWIVRNVAWRFGNTRTSQVDGYTASALKVNSGFATPIGPVLLYHNTLLTDAPGTDAVALLNPGSGTLLYARNNVVAGTRYALYKVNPIPWDGDFDDFYTTDGTRLVSWLGVRYNTLAAYRAAQGQELQGLSAPPQLVSPATGDFTPAPGSPLIDRGIAIAGINGGYLGAAPDIGAVESGVPMGLSIADVTQLEGNGTTPPFEFPVTLSSPSSQPVTVAYATVAGTAVPPGDFTATSGTLSFAPGETAKTVQVFVTGDGFDEADEQFTVELSAPTGGAVILDPTGVGTILDDDPPPALSITDASATEGACTPPVDASFSVLVGAHMQTLTVDYATVPGTATPDADYVPVSGTLTLPPGTDAAVVTVPILDDFLQEPIETFTLHLSNAGNATLPDPDGAGTIDSLDGAPGFRGELAHGSVAVDAILPADVVGISYNLAQRAYASYEVVADAVSGDVQPLQLQRQGCGPVLQTGIATGTGPSRALRWETGTLPVANERVVVRSGGCTTACGPDDVYRLRAYETTGAISRINNSGTQVTVLILQNATTSAVSGHVRFWTGTGTMALQQPFDLPARGLTTLNTAGLPGLAGFSGSATLTHDGPYGALSGKAVALEPATGYSFDTPLQYRPR